MQRHYHKSVEYFRKGTRFLNAGATIRDNLRKSVKINFIDISKEKLSVEIEKIDMQTPKTIFKSSNQIIKDSPDSALILQ